MTGALRSVTSRLTTTFGAWPIGTGPRTIDRILTAAADLCRVASMATSIDPRLSHQGLKILKIFYDNEFGSFSGSQIMRMTTLSSGTLYPILARFERYGLLASQWEREPPEMLGRPRRRLYSMTHRGLLLTRDRLLELGFSSLEVSAARGAESRAGHSTSSLENR